MGKTVLIVEDNPDALDLLGMYFEAHGFNVKSARDGKEGWQALLEERPAAVLSDYLMPNMDGVELCERIRADQRYADIPFILMTGTPHLPTSSCQDMLVTKPLKLEPLVEFIRNAPDEKSPDKS